MLEQVYKKDSQPSPTTVARAVPPSDSEKRKESTIHGQTINTPRCGAQRQLLPSLILKYQYGQHQPHLCTSSILKQNGN